MVTAGGPDPHPRRRRRPHRGGVRRGPSHGVSHAALGGAGASRRRTWSCSAQAAASVWRRCSSASRWAPTSPRSRRRPKSWTWQPHTVRRTSINHRVGRSARRAARRTARRRRRRRRPGRRRSVRTRAALAAPRRPLRHRRLRVGRHPAHPAESGSGQGHSRARLPVPGRCRPTSSPATRTNCATCSPRARVTPHIGAVYPLAETSRALRQVADGKAIGKVLIDLGAE